MTIPTSTANAAMSIVSGLVRLTGRVDRIMAEQTALREDLALPGKVVIKPPPAIQMLRELQTYRDDTAGQQPDPIAGRRDELSALLAQQQPAEDKLVAWMEEVLPDKLTFDVDDPSGKFAATLKTRRGAWDLDDDEIRQLAYYLGPGEDLRETKLPWQLAMSIVDVLSEVVLENQSLIFREDRARPVLVAVLERFSDAELGQVGSHRTFLRVVLKATLNGTLDSVDALNSDKVWVNGVLSAMATARQNTPAGDDFVVGLVQGRGYPLLIGSLLHEGAGFLSSSDASEFERVAADVLTTAGTAVQQRRDFERFFQDHWGDLLRAGLNSVHANGNAILDDTDPLLRNALLASVEVLSKTDNRSFLSGDTLTTVVEAAVGAVALEPGLLDGVDEKWLRELLESTAGVIASNGVRKAFSSNGLNALMQTVLADFARQPELLVAKPGLPREVLGTILEALAAAETPRLETIATAGVQSVLDALTANPDLIHTRYPGIVAALSGELAVALEDLEITRDEAAEILGGVATNIAASPALVGIDQDGLPAEIFATFLGSLAKHRGDLLTSTAIRELAIGVFDVVAADPKLLAGQPDLIRAAAAPMLSELRALVDNAAESPDLKLSQLATAGLKGVLSAIADDPVLLDSRYPAAVSKVALILGQNLVDGKLTAAEVEETLRLAAISIASNPTLLAKEQESLAAQVVGAVLKKILAEDEVRIRGLDLVDVLGEVMAVLAAHGKGLLGTEPVSKLVSRVEVVIDAGLEKAGRELGRLLDRSTVPLVLASLLRRWAMDLVDTLEIDDPRFDQMFSGIVNDVLERAA